ncbi:MAG: hypothetical protein QOJ84_4584 [Bradyrhizobium sp.]|nr:hypothetical protein [Bradyrhizobium sp.]
MTTGLSDIITLLRPLSALGAHSTTNILSGEFHSAIPITAALQMLSAIMLGEWRNTRAIRSARMKPATTSFVRGSPRAARIASEQFSEFQTPRQQLQEAVTTVQIRARI